jgi:hypothetical protein
MTQDQAEQTAAQQRRLRRSVVAAALVILLVVPFLVVGGFSLTTRTLFVRLDGGAAVGLRYDAFEHGYASGVMAVLFGDLPAALAGHAVELVEQNACREREHDLINNREGRSLALRIYAEDPDRWRTRFAEALHAELSNPLTTFSVRPRRNAAIAAICGSD